MFKKNPLLCNDEVDMSSGAGFENSDDDVIDMSGIDENASGFQVIPRGTYDAIVDDVTHGVSQRSGNKMWTWTLEVTTPEFAGRKLFFHSVLTPEQLPRLKKILTRIAPELLEGPFNAREIAEQGVLSGKQLRVRVDIRKYEGQDRNNVKDILPPSEGEGGDSFLG